MYLSERNIYGSSRIGQEQLNKEMEGNSYTYTGLLANEVGDKRYELANHLGNVLEVVTDRKLPSSTYYYGYNFNTGLDGWAACTQAIASQADGQLQISSYGASNCTYILQTTVIGESYTVMIRSNKGTAPGLRLSLFGIGSTNLIDGENTWITFTATSTTTGLIIEPTSTAASYVYYVDAVEIYQNSRYVADVVSYSDYYPYGMQMPGRNGNSGDYRYGFNGMEADDEVKTGTKNSYDFGARMYDPRVGRWLTLDPLAKKQPSWSPYKAMMDNPIFWIDPDGRTEYETIIFRNEQTGETIKVYRSVSSKVMTDGVVCNNHHKDVNHQDYYDYRHVTTYTFTTNGELIVSKTKDEILYGNGVKYKDYVPLDNLFGTVAKNGDTYDPKDKFFQSAGFHMTGNRGQGTKYHSRNAEDIGNIDDLIDIMSNYKASGKFTMKNPKEILGDDDGLWSMLETLMNELSKNTKKIGSVQKVVDKIRKELGGESTSSNEMSGSSDYTPSTSGDTTITINQWERGNGWTRNHVKDTTVKKADVDKIDQNRELPKAKY